MTVAVVRKTNNKFTMEGTPSSIPNSTPSSSFNSRSTAIRTILLTAWRAKLTNEEWEARVRKILPRGVNGDVYDLADCLLKQALIGPVPNQLFISYLKHAVRSELVSYGAVLRSISSQPINLRSSSHLLYRTSSIVCILEFLQLFRDKISCNGSEIECLNLCHSLSNLIHWLLKCVLHTLDYMISCQSSLQQHQQLNNTPSSNLSTSSGALLLPNNSNSTAPSNNITNSGSSSLSSNIDTTLGIIDLCTETIRYFIEKPFTKSLLFINKIEYTKEFDENIIKTAQSILQKLTSFPQLQCIQEKVTHFNILNQIDLTFNSRDLHPSMVAASQLGYLQTHRIRSTQINSSNSFEKRMQQYSAQPAHDSSTNYALFNSLYPLVAFDAILRPARSNRHLARQIVTIATFNSAPVNMAYCELIRSCLIGLIDAQGNSKAKALWAFFTFLKLPRLLIELNRMFRKYANSKAFSPTELNQANIFINDLKQAFERLCEYSPLLDEAEYKCNCDLIKCLVKELIKNDQSLINLKNLDLRKFPARRPNNGNNNNSLGGHMMLRTEPVVTSMLETLNSEQDPADLFSILLQSCASYTFEYIWIAAAATGRLHLFITRLAEHNELYRQPRESTRHSQDQDLSFDITFLILIYIAQRYGPKLIDKNKALFNKWYHERYEQESCFNCPKEMLKDCNDQVVSNLLEYLIGHSDTIQASWRSVVFNLPKAISEILNAWEQGVLDDRDIAIVIERLRNKMCFMAVVAASWLRSHIRTLVESDKVRPLFILSSLTKSNSSHSKHQDVSNVSDSKSDGHKERLSLMGAIVKRISFEITPVKHTSSSSSSSTKNVNRNHGATINSLTSTTSTNMSMNGNGSATESDDSQDDQAYHSYKDRFISTLTTQEIFLANVRQCLSRGWLDYDSLNSLNSLFNIIGSTCFTKLIVDLILTSHESPSDLGRAVNITFGLFHLDIEACAFTLIRDIIPSWLMGERKQALLNQPRAFALASLTVMTIIEVYDNLTSSLTRQLNDGLVTNNNNIECDREKKLNINGVIKREPGLAAQTKSTPMMIDGREVPISSNVNAPRDAKRIKYMQDDLEQHDKVDKCDRLKLLDDYIADLMRLFKEIMSDPVMSHRTLFPVLFLQQAVICAREGSSIITAHIQPEILLDIIDLFSSEMTFELVLAISNLSSTNSRKYTAKAICKLAQKKELKQKPSIGPYNSGSNSYQAGSSTTGGAASSIANAHDSQNLGSTSASYTGKLVPAGTSNSGSATGKFSGSGSAPMIIG